MHTFLALIVALLAASAANASDRIPECSREGFTLSSAATLKACDALLALPSLTDEERYKGTFFRGRSLHRLSLVAKSNLDSKLNARLSNDAIDAYETLLKVRPDDRELHLHRAWIAFNVGDIARAVAEIELASKGDPAWLAEVDILKSILLLVQDRRRQAFQLIQRAAAIAPDNPSVLFKLAQFYNEVGTLPDAIRTLDRLLILPPASIAKPEQSVMNGRFVPYRVDAYTVRGEFLEHLGRMEDAEKTFDELVARDPSSMTYIIRARFSKDRKAPLSRIKPDIDRALALEPEDWFARRELGHFLYSQRDFAGAAREYGRASRLRPHDGQLRWGYALTLRFIGQTEEAAVEGYGALTEGDAGFFRRQTALLRKHGYLYDTSDTPSQKSLRDATLACMADEKCR